MSNLKRMKAAIARNRAQAGEPAAVVVPPGVCRGERPEAAPPVPKPQAKKDEWVGRFPSGSCFGKLEWDGKTWDAEFIVPLVPGVSVKFFATDQGVHKLLRKIGQQYGKWLKKQEKEPGS